MTSNSRLDTDTSFLH